MEKSLIIFGIFIIFLIIYFLQSNFFTWFNIAGIQPNLFIILVLFVGLYGGKTLGFGTGIIIGIFLDIFIGRNYGITSILYGSIGFFGGYLDKNFSKDSKITVMLMVISSTLIFETLFYLINSLNNNANIEIISFIKIVLIETIFNIILTIILYPLLNMVKDIVEENFKTRNILTKYF